MRDPILPELDFNIPGGICSSCTMAEKSSYCVRKIVACLRCTKGSDLQNEHLAANENGGGTVISREARRKGVVRFAPKGYHRRRSTDGIPLREKERGRKRRPLSNISNVVENREPLTKSTKTRRIECPAAEPHTVEGSILAVPA
jgi:hypothetical protein